MADAGRLRLVEPVPPYGAAMPFAPGIARVVARNPGPMTYHGTNTWLIALDDDTVAVLDPGPDDPTHLASIRRAAGNRRIAHVLVTHHHADHVAGAAPLADALGLPVSAHADMFTRAGLGRVGRTLLRDGDRIGCLVAVATPGHAQEHLCFAHDDRLLFTGDHVMGWSTAVVPPPPAGDASDYVDSLRRLAKRSDQAFLPAHGPPIERPRAMLRALIAGRIRRERLVQSGLRESGPVGDEELTRLLYPMLKPGLERAALNNVRGLLCKLARDGSASCAGGLWSASLGDQVPQ